MFKTRCPYCPYVHSSSANRASVQKNGAYKRKSDHRTIRRFKCLRCDRYFSLASRHPCYGQNKRQLNDRIEKLFCSGVSQRRIARLLSISRDTVTNKLRHLGARAKANLTAEGFQYPSSEDIQFDDLETFEHTILKPLSVTLAVESRTRRILGFKVSRMPARGLLARPSVKKYGKRKDERQKARGELFREIIPLVNPFAKIRSDQNPHYPPDVRRYFPFATHETHAGQRGSVVGQGELKKIRFDPLFSLNHTCAMLRANINRLFRKTWCTTKKPERLADHIAIYAKYHNKYLRVVQAARMKAGQF